MPGNIENGSQSEPEEHEEILRINNKEFKKGDLVLYDNGDGIEKDWRFSSFDGKEVVVFKIFGEDKNKEYHGNAIYKGMKNVKKSVPINQFIEWQSE